MSDECNSSQSSDVSTLVSLENEIMDLNLEDNADNCVESTNNVEVQKTHCTRKEPTEMTKVVVRRLPPNMTKETFVKVIEPVPEYDYLYFVKPDGSNAPHLYSRAYINFKIPDDVYTFKEKFDNYVFLDQKGAEYPAVVEYSNFQRIPKKRVNRKKDPKCGTLETDPMFNEFLDLFDKPTEKDEKVEFCYKFEVKKVSSAATLTPLVEYVQQKRFREQKSRFKDEQRRLRENERKRAKEDERRRKRLADKTKKEQTRKETRVESHRKDSNIVRKTYVGDTVKKLGGSGGYQSKGNDTGNIRKPYGDTLRKGMPLCGQQVKIGDTRKITGTEKGDSEKFEKQDKFSGVRRHDWDSKQSPSYNYKQGNRYESTAKKNMLNVKDMHKKGFTSQPPGKSNVPVTPTKVRPASFIQEDETGKKSPEEQGMSASCRVQFKPKFEKPSIMHKKVEEQKKCKDDDAKQIGTEVVIKEQKVNTSKIDDPRRQRQIRNKDRPDLQIYRPGMGRLSKDRVCLSVDNGGKGDGDKEQRDKEQRDKENNSDISSSLKSKTCTKKSSVSVTCPADSTEIDDTQTPVEN